MARTAAIRTKFVQTKVDTSPGSARRFVDYNVEEHQGQVRRTVGRVMGSTGPGGSSWAALAVNGTAWTPWYTTRAGAVAAMRGE